MVLRSIQSLSLRLDKPYIQSCRYFFDKANRNWETAWQMELTPWDLRGTVCPPLMEAVQKSKIPITNTRIALVPGCGTGYECIYLRKAGFAKVIGMDLSQTAIDRANQYLQANEPKMGSVQFEQGDFFTFSREKYDFIFDYLFFAALDPPLREKWSDSMKRLIKPNGNGILATLIFPLRKSGENQLQGPPYPVALEDYQELLLPRGFELIEVDKVSLLYCHLSLIKSLFVSELGNQVN